MAGKKGIEEVEKAEVKKTEIAFLEGAEEEDFDPDVDINITGDDFNAQEEYKLAPLIPRGVYRANVTDVTFDAEKQSVVWKLCLDGNGGVMTDGTTAVDGVVTEYRNWLPKIGDENVLTDSGKMTKRQAKINMLKEFGDKMKISINTKKEIIQGLINKEWIGLSCIITVGSREYQGKVFNEVKEMKAA